MRAKVVEVARLAKDPDADAGSDTEQSIAQTGAAIEAEVRSCQRWHRLRRSRSRFDAQVLARVIISTAAERIGRETRQHAETRERPHRIARHRPDLSRAEVGAGVVVFVEEAFESDAEWEERSFVVETYEPVESRRRGVGLELSELKGWTGAEVQRYRYLCRGLTSDRQAGYENYTSNRAHAVKSIRVLQPDAERQRRVLNRVRSVHDVVIAYLTEHAEQQWNVQLRAHAGVEAELTPRRTRLDVGVVVPHAA